MKTENKYRILVVDDNKTNIQVLGNILQNTKYLVGFAFNGKEALNILKNDYNYDLVLLDINMPEMDGFETCKAIHDDEKLKDLAIIFLTASHETEKIIRGFELGAQDYVTKPFNQQELLARVKTQLQIIQKNRDISEYAKKLEILNATKNKFFSIIAHDLRNPFAGLTNILRTLRLHYNEFDSNKIKEMIDIMYDATTLTHSMLENLLTWSRAQTGSIKFNPKNIELVKITDECINIVNIHAQNKSIKIFNNIPENLIIKADSYQMTTILLNLITNAIKYTPNKGKITISSKVSNEMVEISITDTGIGMSKETIEKLFKIEANISSMPGTNNEVGTGLGMILSKEFISKHGGTIYVQSKEGKGSTFTFTIPQLAQK